MTRVADPSVNFNAPIFNAPQVLHVCTTQTTPTEISLSAGVIWMNHDMDSAVDFARGLGQKRFLSDRLEIEFLET
ncbi:MAG: hypothetical protein CMH52_06880 [Myxococcales bacterium]|nr:hypothetical protein [Myxococcales bacterium]